MVFILDSNGQIWGNFDVNGGNWANLTANLAALSGNVQTIQLYDPNPNTPGNVVLLAGLWAGSIGRTSISSNRREYLGACLAKGSPIPW